MIKSSCGGRGSLTKSDVNGEKRKDKSGGVMRTTYIYRTHVAWPNIFSERKNLNEMKKKARPEGLL